MQDSAAGRAEAAAVEVEGLRKVFRSRRRGDVVAVDGLSFSVSSGELVGLLGPNGAGKTTTIKSICTLVRPTAGEIRVLGVDALRHPTKAVEKVAAVLEGNRNIYWRLTPRENLEFFASLQGIHPKSVKGEIEELMERFGLVEKRNTDARALSRGMQQKLAVACAFIRNAPVLLLDEPTLGLDVESSHELRAELKQMAAKGERTILLSSHAMDVVQDICERVIVINHGRVVTDDRVDNLLTLFKARAYQFVIRGTLTPLQDASLRQHFPMIEISTDSYETSIVVELFEATRLYDLIEVLRTERSVIEKIEPQDPDLEEIFLRIVKGEVRE